VPLAVWRHIFDWISRQAQGLSKLLDKWRGLRVVLLDGMCVSMPELAYLFDAFRRPITLCDKSKLFSGQPKEKMHIRGQ